MWGGNPWGPKEDTEEEDEIAGECNLQFPVGWRVIRNN